MPVHYSHIAFALHILQLLADRDRDRKQMLDLVGEFFDQSDRSIEDVKQKFDRTLRELRDCGFDIDHRPYRLVESNFPLILSASQRQALYRGADFLKDLGFSTEAELLIHLTQQLEPQLLSDIRGDFSPPADYSHPDYSSILQELENRCAQQRRFTLRYVNSQKQDKTWDLDRCELRLHDGALYLFAFVPEFQTEKPELVYKNCLFRIDRIKSIGPPGASSWLWSSFPSLTIRYRMTGPLATYKPRRSHEQVIERNLKKKYVEIETTEDYPFWFRQRILRYGANARVLSPPQIVAEVSSELRRALSNYDDAIE